MNGFLLFWFLFLLGLTLLLAAGIMMDNKKNTGKFRFYRKDIPGLMKLFFIVLITGLLGAVLKAAVSG